MSDTISENQLEHVGVKGMRWGIRKATTRGSTPPSNRKPVSEKADKPKAKPKPKSAAKSMTDAQLREAIQRLQMERQYQQLTTPEKNKSVIKEVLANSGKQVAMNVLTQVGSAYIQKAVGVQLNKRLPEEYQVTGKKK